MRLIPFTIFGLFFAEIAVLIWVGGKIGILSVILLLILGVFVGGAMIRASGANALAVIRGSAWDSKHVSNQAAKGLLLCLSGILLILPGFLSDIAGFALLLPPVRTRVSRFFEQHMTIVSSRYPPRPGRPGPVIEGEAIEIETDGELPPKNDNPSPWRQ